MSIKLAADRHLLVAGITAVAVLLIPLSAAPGQTPNITPIMLRDAGQIRDAAEINAAIDALAKDAEHCTPRTQVCICSFRASVDRLDEAYRNAVGKNPSWGRPNTGVEYYQPENGTVGIVISNVKRELAMCGRE
jgi:hypothetical protein